MSKLSQRELLNEGVWDTVKSGGRLVGGAVGAGVKGIAKGLDVVAPELTNPLHKLDSGARRYAREIYDEFLRIWKGKKLFIAKKLLDVGFELSKRSPFKKVSGGNYLVYAKKIVDYTKDGKPIFQQDKKGHDKLIPLVVDPVSGFITKNLNDQVRNLTNRPAKTK